jgi:hypothetical protein
MVLPHLVVCCVCLHSVEDGILFLNFVTSTNAELYSHLGVGIHDENSSNMLLCNTNLAGRPCLVQVLIAWKTGITSFGLNRFTTRDQDHHGGLLGCGTILHKRCAEI